MFVVVIGTVFVVLVVILVVGWDLFGGARIGFGGMIILDGYF